MKEVLRAATAGDATRRVARAAGQGLAQVLLGADPVPAWWRSRWRRRGALALAALGAALLGVALLAAALAFSRPGANPASGPHPLQPRLLLLVPAALAPLPLAAR